MKRQIYESLDKYLRNIFYSNDPCRDSLNLAVFDSKDPRFLVAILCRPPICQNLKSHSSMRQSSLIDKVNFVNWDRESTVSHFSRLVSFDFLRFVMAITIAGEVTGNRLTGLSDRLLNSGSNG